jgi:hypothetical protein
MTPEEFATLLALPAGPLLDAAIARHVLGWEERVMADHRANPRPEMRLIGLITGWYNAEGIYIGMPSAFSTHIEPAWRLVTRYEARGWNWQMQLDTGQCVTFRWYLPHSQQGWSFDDAIGHDTTPPGAICRATLAAVLRQWE